MIPSAEPLAFFNHQVMPLSQARLPLHDAGFVMGATATDLCRTFHQRLYRWEQHLARFRQSCQSIGIMPAISNDEISARAEQILAHNRRLPPVAEFARIQTSSARMLNSGEFSYGAGKELALVMFATPGPIGYYLGEPGGAGDGPVTFGMHTYPLPLARFRRWVENGVSLVVPSVRQVPADTIDPHIKQRSRLHWWLAEREAHRQEPGATALLLDHAGHVTETAAANFLIVRRGVVISPPRSTVLEGISLGVVQELCEELQIPFAEQPLTLEDCLAAEEAMLSNTSYCLVGVSRLQGVSLPFPGTILSRLVHAWNAKVGLDIHGQILAAEPAHK